MMGTCDSGPKSVYIRHVSKCKNFHRVGETPILKPKVHRPTSYCRKSWRGNTPHDPMVVAPMVSCLLSSDIYLQRFSSTLHTEFVEEGVGFAVLRCWVEVGVDCSQLMIKVSILHRFRVLLSAHVVRSGTEMTMYAPAFINAPTKPPNGLLGR